MAAQQFLDNFSNYTKKMFKSKIASEWEAVFKQYDRVLQKLADSSPKKAERLVELDKYLKTLSANLQADANSASLAKDELEKITEYKLLVQFSTAIDGCFSSCRLQKSHRS
jgi:hypothetical protein